MDLMSFDDCLKLAKGKKHLLLGNGFSISCRPSIFTYGNLFAQAQPKFNTHLNDAFNAIDTKDFEVVMKSLKNAASLSEIYDKGNSYKKKMTDDSDLLKSILVSTIASSHPTQPNDITETEFSTCRKFLINFENKYTLNYDLLLYWTLMHEEPLSKLKIKHDDGFRTPSDGKADYVTWEINNTNQQTVFYLHGALHLFDAGEELQKFTWVNTGVRLTEQITTALDKDFYPLFVSEGSSSEKREKIGHSGYLSRGIRSFANIGGSLFIYGHSLADNDDHITNLIPDSKLEYIFISIYGDTESHANNNIILKAGKLVEDRKAINIKKSKGAVALRLYFYDAASTSIWK